LRPFHTDPTADDTPHGQASAPPTAAQGTLPSRQALGPVTRPSHPCDRV